MRVWTKRTHCLPHLASINLRAHQPHPAPKVTGSIENAHLCRGIYSSSISTWAGVLGITCARVWLSRDAFSSHVVDLPDVSGSAHDQEEEENEDDSAIPDEETIRFVSLHGWPDHRGAICLWVLEELFIRNEYDYGTLLGSFGVFYSPISPRVL
jgi:hypothetical protein